MSAVQSPSFSVIMAVYNRTDYLREAIESVQLQTCGDWELILIDDGSTDHTSAIVDQWAGGDRRIHVFHEAHAGLAAARNHGLRVARGRWIAYLDSDDVWFPQTLDYFARYIDRHGDARFLYGYRHRLRDGRITHLRGVYEDRFTGPDELFHRMFLSPMSVCHDRELAMQVGGYDPNLRYCDDYDFFLRMSMQCSLEPIGLATGLKRRHRSNMSRISGESQMVEAEVLRRFAQRHGAKAGLGAAGISKRLGRIYFRAAKEYFREHRYACAFSALQLAQQFRWTIRGWALAVLSRQSVTSEELQVCQVPRLVDRQSETRDHAIFQNTSS